MLRSSRIPKACVMADAPPDTDDQHPPRTKEAQPPPDPQVVVGKVGSTQPAVTPRQQSLLDPDLINDVRFEDLARRLDRRSTYHGFLSWAFLLIGIGVGCFVVFVLFYSGHVLVRDFDPASLNAPILAGLDDADKHADAALLSDEKKVVAAKTQLKNAFLPGRIWVNQEIPSNLKAQLSWIDVHGLTGLVVGDGQFAYSRDGGDSWQLPTFQSRATTPFEANGAGAMLGSDAHLQAWVAGKRATISRLSDADADTWEPVSVDGLDGSPAKGDVQFLSFRDEKTGWASGTDGLLASTSDGGSHWRVSESHTTSMLFEVKFFSDKVGVAIGSGLTILTTYDSGEHWNDESNAIRQYVAAGQVSEYRLLHVKIDSDRSFSDVKRVYIVGASGNAGVIIVGTRTGPTSIQWRFASTPDGKKIDGSQDIRSLRWVEQLGTSSQFIAVGDEGSILYSPNEGNTWSPVAPGDKRPNLLFARSTSANNATINGANGYIASVVIPPAPGLPQISVEHSESKNNTIYDVSSGQRVQFAAGAGMLRSVFVSRAMQALVSEDDKLFRGQMVDDNSVAALLEGVPVNASEYSLFQAVRQSLEQVNDDIVRLKSEGDERTKQRVDTLKGNSVSAGDLMLWVTGARALVAIVAFFILRYFITLSRVNLNYAAFYKSRGDVLRSMLIIPGGTSELSLLFSPNTLDDSALGATISDTILSAVKGVGDAVKGGAEKVK